MDQHLPWKPGRFPGEARLSSAKGQGIGGGQVDRRQHLVSLVVTHSPWLL